MQNKTIAIIGAMDCEIDALKNIMKDISSSSNNNLTIYSGKIYDNKVVLAKCGVGKVNAALNTQYIIDKFNPSIIINTGVAGGIKKDLSVGDIVIGESFVQYDFDASALGYAKGYMCTGVDNDKPTIYYSSKELISKFEKIVSNMELDGNKITIHKGRIATGDTFISSSEKKQELERLFNAAAVEMEAGAIAQTSNINNIPCLIIRAISDLADGSAPLSLSQVETKMAQVASSTIEILLRNF
jgi:adenosylhomocysteine nucleosidase